MSTSGDVTGDDDNFGLPDLDFKPLNSPPTPSSPPKPEPTLAPNTPFTAGYQHPSEKVEPNWEEKVKGPAVIQPSVPSKPAASEPVSDRPAPPLPPAPKVPVPPKSTGGKGPSAVAVLLWIFIPLLLLGGGYYGYIYLEEQRAQRDEEIDVSLEKEKGERKRKESEVEPAEDQESEAPTDVVLPPAPVAAGQVEQLTGPTRKYYVVIASTLDPDLIMDEARRVSATGVNCKVIPPFGKSKFHRLGILEQDNMSLARQKADESRSTYGNNIWVLYY